MVEFLFLIRYPLTNTNPTFILPANMFGIRFILSLFPYDEKQYPKFFIACKCYVLFDLLGVKIGHYLFYGSLENSYNEALDTSIRKRYY